MIERLKELRVKNNLTQADIAKMLKVQREVYRRYENGSRSIPVELLIKLADFYSVSLDYIVNRQFGDDESK